MNKRKKVYVVGLTDKEYASWLNDYLLTDNLEEADIVMFTGGEDVDPSLYGCEKHSTTYSNLKRDYAEKAIFEQVKPNQLCVGICRGAQLLTVLNGGLLIQNVSGHAMFGTHTIINLHGSDRYEITSTHHQMQYPFNLESGIDFDLLYVTNKRSLFYEGDGIEKSPTYEPEIVLYHKEGLPKCLAIQGHPEIMRKEAPVIGMLNKLVNSLCD